MTTETKRTQGRFTPGPWRAKRTEYSAGNWDILAFVGREHPICQTSCYDAEANARLIAAAPDLLEALRALVYFHDTDDTPAFDIWAKARQQIALAGGKGE